MPFSAFALAVDRFVTIGRRTAQFCFGLLMRCLFWGSPRPPGLLTRQLCRSDSVCRRSSVSSQSNSVYWGGPPSGVQILYTFPTPKIGIKQIEQSNDIILRILRRRLESQSWNSFNSFPIAKEVSAGIPIPPDPGKTPQLRISKLEQNWGKTEILHLQPSYGICWSHEIEILPPMWTKDSSHFECILLFFNRMTLNPDDIQNPTCNAAALGVQGGGGSPKTNNASRDQNKTEECDA